MRKWFHRLILLTTGTILLGHAIPGAGSARAEELPPVAVDLVDLALALPEAAAKLKLTNSRLEFATEQRKKGYIPDDSVFQLRVESESAAQRLQFLRRIVEAEFEAATLRVEYLKARARGATGVTQSDIRTAELRRNVLHAMKEAAAEPAEQDDTSSRRPTREVQPGTYTGVVTVMGNVPGVPQLTEAQEADDQQSAPPSDIGARDESVIVGANNGLANVFVYLAEPPAAALEHGGVPEEPVTLTSRDRQFHPRCALVRVGQELQLNNDESVLTNVHLFPLRNQPGNYGIRPNEYAGPTIQFRRVEPKPVLVGDDIYPGKRAYLLVLDHPFAAVTDETGRFRIEGLPPGEYEFRFWHERVGWVERTRVIIGADGAAEAKIMIEAERLLEP